MILPQEEDIKNMEDHLSQLERINKVRWNLACYIISKSNHLKTGFISLFIFYFNLFPCMLFKLVLFMAAYCFLISLWCCIPRLYSLDLVFKTPHSNLELGTWFCLCEDLFIRHSSSSSSTKRARTLKEQLPFSRFFIAAPGSERSRPVSFDMRVLQSICGCPGLLWPCLGFQRTSLVAVSLLLQQWPANRRPRFLTIEEILGRWFYSSSFDMCWLQWTFSGRSSETQRMTNHRIMTEMRLWNHFRCGSRLGGNESQSKPKSTRLDPHLDSNRFISAVIWDFCSEEDYTIKSSVRWIVFPLSVQC